MHSYPLLVFLPHLLLVATAPSPLNTRQGGSTSNCVGTGQCQATTVIFARGTTEPGNIGSVVGPPLKSALGANTCFQGVDYAADVAGFVAGGDAAGAATMAGLVSQAASDCPNSAIVMSGYSQGAQVVSKAAAQLSTADLQRVNAVVLFGNPNGPDTPVPGIDQADTKIFCANGDLICAGQSIVLPAHLSYGSDAGEAAAFIQSKTGN